MSKKKATMTLKDFHGGSIPSDLPLPSAPGVIARPSDRPCFDRHGAAWGNPMGRSDHRLRPGSAGAVRNLDDKTPFLGPAAHFGKNFDEDERKPLDGGWGTRRTVSDESIGVLPMRTELKLDYSTSGTLPVPHMSNSSASSYAGRVSEANSGGLNSQNVGRNSSYSPKFSEASNVCRNSSNLGGNSGQAHPNAWSLRKEAARTIEPVSATWSGPNAATKLAHASALEKVSSGRWQSKQVVYHPPDVEVIRKNPIESQFGSEGDGFYPRSSYHHENVGGGVEYHGEVLVRHADRSLTVDGGIRAGGEFPNYERSKSPMSLEALESNLPRYVQEVQSTRNNGKFGGFQLQSEHAKLELHPRPKPLESLEQPVNLMKGYQQPHSSGDPEDIPVSYGSTNPVKSGLSRSHQAVERPKLNLKPRSQPLEGNIETKRNTLFGGGRPRELVLKDRAIDDGDINNQKTNWRSQNHHQRRDNTKTETNLPHERPPSPETWRKSAEKPKTKAASAVELAQAFSRSVSDTKKPNLFSGQKGGPNRVLVPFSRLMDPSSRPQINGY